MPAVEGHFALRKALQREIRSLQRFAQMLTQFSDVLLRKMPSSN
jgi:hypothetical protein